MAANEDDENWFRPVWEDSEEDTPPPLRRQTAASRPSLTFAANAESIPRATVSRLLRAHDALSRLDTRSRHLPQAVGAGALSRIMIAEAQGYLSHIGSRLKYHDLALRIAGRLVAPAEDLAEADSPEPLDHIHVNMATSYARQVALLPSLSHPPGPAAPHLIINGLQALGHHVADQDAFTDWMTADTDPYDAPGLLLPARLLYTGLPGWTRRDELDLTAAYVAACVWRCQSGFRGAPLLFWSGPTNKLNLMARAPAHTHTDLFLECVTEAAYAALRLLERTALAAERVGQLQERKSGYLKQAGLHAVETSIISAASLAATLDISRRAAQDLLARLTEAGIITELTGRQSWRAYGLR